MTGLGLGCGDRIPPETPVKAVLILLAITVFVFGAVFAGYRGYRLYVAIEEHEQKTQSESARIVALQKRNEELEKDYADMLRNAMQFRDELEACRREKGFEWRERMEAVCSGCRAEVTP